jgi:transmembrane sensor
MSSTKSPIDRDVLAELRQGDERAFERVFRDRYADLTAEAQTELDADGVAAPRVVEEAFLSAWKARTRFETPQSLDAFLHEHVHMNAVRERSRRASLHRFEAHGRPPGSVSHHTTPVTGVDDAWRHVSAILHAPPPTEESHAHARDAIRHEAAEHVKAIGRPTPWLWPTVLAVVLGLITIAALRWVDRTSAQTAITKALAAPDARSFSARPGQRASVTLGDGSRVTVGAESRLAVPARFGGTLRAAMVEGTAAFAVSEGTPPLEIRAGQAAVTSDGGQVDVSAFGQAPDVLVRVRSGSATVRTAEASRTLNANQALLTRASGEMTTPDAATVDAALGWTVDRFVVTNQPLRDVLPQFARWYGTRLDVRDPALLERRATVSASLGSSREAIAAIERSANVRMEWEGRQMMLRDAGAAPAPPPAPGRR